MHERWQPYTSMKGLVIGLLFFITLQLNAQQSGDVDSLMLRTIDGIVNMAFKAISSLEGEIGNLNKIRNIYLPNAKFTVLYHKSDSIPLKYESLTLDQFFEYLQDEKEYYEKGFEQYALGSVVNEYNGIANVFQSFYAKDSQNREAKGITSYQLVYFDGRWWISDVLWTTDTNGVPIPKKYLKK